MNDPFRQPGRWVAGPDGTEFRPVRRMPPPRQRSTSFFTGRRPAQVTLADPGIGQATTALPPGLSGRSSSLATILGAHSTRRALLVGGAIGVSLFALGLLISNHALTSSNRTGASLQSRGASTVPTPQATAPVPTSTLPVTTKPPTLAPVPPGRSSVDIESTDSGADPRGNRSTCEVVEIWTLGSLRCRNGFCDLAAPGTGTAVIGRDRSPIASEGQPAVEFLGDLFVFGHESLYVHVLKIEHTHV